LDSHSSIRSILQFLADHNNGRAIQSEYCGRKWRFIQALYKTVWKYLGYGK